MNENDFESCIVYDSQPDSDAYEASEDGDVIMVQDKKPQATAKKSQWESSMTTRAAMKAMSVTRPKFVVAELQGQDRYNYR